MKPRIPRQIKTVQQFIILCCAAAVVLFKFISPQNAAKDVQKPSVPTTASAAAVSPGDFLEIERVFDGDTFKLTNGEKVRLIGIDCPELHDNAKLNRDIQKTGQNKQYVMAQGKRAFEFTKQLLANKKVRLEFDRQPRDRYGRLLAYVYLEDGTFVNAEIIKHGYASPMTIKPNDKYADTFRDFYEEARVNKSGLWKVAGN